LDADGGVEGVEALFASQLQISEQVLSSILAGKSALLQWAPCLPALTHLDMQRVDIGPAELRRLAGGLPGLEHLGVGDLNLSVGPLEAPLPPLSSVTKLVSHSISNEGALRGTFPALRALSCDSSDGGLRTIGELTDLVNLFLWASPSDDISDTGLAALSCLRSLQTFRLEGSGELSDGGWVRFTAAHSGLTRLDLVRCPQLTDIGFILAIRPLSALRRLSLADLPGLGAPALAAVLACCPGLELVEVQDCPGVTLAAVRHLLASVSRPDLDMVYRKGGSSRTLHGSCRS
ncbi:hypothetical protein Agub_g8911, partial [Astrephomene gubernaculifera]